MMTLGEKIRELRKRKNLTQQQLADLCHMERRLLWGYENDRNKPSANTYVLLAKALGCNLDYLMESDTDPKEGCDYWSVFHDFIEYLKKLDHVDAMKMISDVISAYSQWLSENPENSGDITEVNKTEE